MKTVSLPQLPLSKPNIFKLFRFRVQGDIRTEPAVGLEQSKREQGRLHPSSGQFYSRPPTAPRTGSLHRDVQSPRAYQGKTNFGEERRPDNYGLCL